jgi:multidrug efflux system membrane fusion protein
VRTALRSWCGISLLAAALLAGACSREPREGPAGGGAGGAGGRAPAVPVTVGQVTRRDMPEQLLGIGTIESAESVMLRPQIDGQLIEVKFEEGQDVKAGDVMFMVDPRPYEAALAEAEAMLAKDQVMAEDAERAAAQMAEALANRAISRRDADKAQAEARAARAQVSSDQAAVDAARLRLEYCRVTSPIDGRAGSLLANVGNIVEARQTDLVQINQIAPIYASFAVPEQNLARIRAQQAAAPLRVAATIPGTGSDAGEPIQGELSFIDNKVDTTTGTVRLKAVFENADRRLWPGQFVNLVLTISVESGAVVAPSSAVQKGQGGTFVYVVKDDRTVEQRAVVSSRRIGNDLVISSGLQPGETVVTDGQLRLVPGAAIEIVEKAPASPQPEPKSA